LQFIPIPRTNTNEINFITAFNTCAALNIRIPSRLGKVIILQKSTLSIGHHGRQKRAREEIRGAEKRNSCRKAKDSGAFHVAGF
jgi:hypothetical protein